MERKDAINQAEQGSKHALAMEYFTSGSYETHDYMMWGVHTWKEGIYERFPATLHVPLSALAIQEARVVISKSCLIMIMRIATD